MLTLRELVAGFATSVAVVSLALMLLEVSPKGSVFVGSM